MTDVNVTVTSGSNVNVSMTAVGPQGTGLGLVLQDYAVKGQIAFWAGSVTLNADLGNSIQATLIGDVSDITLTGWPPAGQEGKMVLYLVQGVGAPHVVEDWPESIKWIGGFAPTLSTIAENVDVIVLTTVDGGATVYGFFTGTAS